jgi:hypothetical protein
MNLTMTFDVPNIPLLNPSQARAILQEELAHAADRILEEIATKARLKAPVDTGVLRSSIAHRVMPGTGQSLVVGRVGPGPQAPYAPDVEHGTEPHWIDDIEGLKGWARRVLGDANRAYAVRHAIAKRGTHAHPFMAPSVEIVEPMISPIVEGAVAVALRRIEGVA